MSSFAQSVLVIGDSHMTSPLGLYLYEDLKPYTSELVVKGNASSAPFSWLGDKIYSYTGGTFSASTNKETQSTYWKLKKPVPKLKDLLTEQRPDLVVVELGANDVRAITDLDGNIDQYNFKKRLVYAREMVELINIYGARCAWVGPPNGASKSEASQKVIYKLLKEALEGECEFFETDQRKYFAEGKSHSKHCDGYHFSCTKTQKAKVKEWSKEILHFLKSKKLL